MPLVSSRNTQLNSLTQNGLPWGSRKEDAGKFDALGSKRITCFQQFQSIFNFFSNLRQSAIKAKLLELGTGSQTGYIDDELPDYVMIMVANKRSQENMNQDLKLFLGSNTGRLNTLLPFFPCINSSSHRNIRQLAPPSAAEAARGYFA